MQEHHITFCAFFWLTVFFFFLSDFFGVVIELLNGKNIFFVIINTAVLKWKAMLLELMINKYEKKR